jgi:pimeloyl-ACP methyl ester carboxylesterase
LPATHRTWRNPYAFREQFTQPRQLPITFNARGHPPSDVPKDNEQYSQEQARDDIRSVLDALKIDKAHIVGLSMGGFAALHFGFAYPERCRSLVVAG